MKMAFITGGNSSLVLNIQPLQNVNTSVTGQNQINTLNTNVNNILKYINTTTGAFSANTISLKDTATKYILFKNDVQLASNVGLFINNAQLLNSNTLNGTDRLYFSVAGVKKATLTNTGFGIGVMNPRTRLDVNGTALIRDDMYITSLSTFNENPEPTKGNLFVENAIYASSITLGPFFSESFDINSRFASPFLTIMPDSSGNLLINGNTIVTKDNIIEIQTSSIGVGIQFPEAAIDLSGNEIIRGNLTISSMTVPAYGNITMDGTLGIGTTIPEVAVDVVGSEVVRGTMYIGNVNDVQNDSPGDLYTSGKIYTTGVNVRESGVINKNLYVGDIPSTQRYTSGSLYVSGGTILSSLGIGAIQSTVATLDISGSELVRGDLYVSTFNGRYPGKGNIFADGMMYVSSIGIGVRTPSARLDILGNMRSRGNLYILSSITSNLVNNTGNVYADGYIYSKGTMIPSDLALKQNVRPYSYKRVLPEAIEFEWKHSGEYDIGVSANDVLKIEPTCVTKNSEGVLHVDYPKLSVLCLAEIKHLRGRVEQLEARMNSELPRKTP